MQACKGYIKVFSSRINTHPGEKQLPGRVVLQHRLSGEKGENHGQGHMGPQDMSEILIPYLKGLGESFYPLTLIYTVGRIGLSVPSCAP